MQSDQPPVSNPEVIPQSKHLIVTGDDFGLCPRVNEEVERCHQSGLLTQASLMVNEGAVDEALRIARRNPKLCVGLHLTLCCGRAAELSPLTDSALRLLASPAWAGLRYAFDPRLEGALSREIAAQFEAFRAHGLPPTYWDGHTHLHLHPTIMKLTLPVAAQHQFRATRLVREPGGDPLQVIFRLLSRAAAPQLVNGGTAFADCVYGLRDTGRVTTHQFETYLARQQPGWSEVYFHPGAEPAPLDCELLLELIEMEGIRLGSSAELISAARERI
jgi:predicted glycoside hydrolase/deacetylase ChbG (UPF0249 family)